MGKLDYYKNLVFVGPVPPFQGGIADYVYIMQKILTGEFCVCCLSFKLDSKLYFLLSRRKDISPNRKFSVPEARFLLPRLGLLEGSLNSAFQWLRETNPAGVIVQWWHPVYFLLYYILICWLNKQQIPVYIDCHNFFPHEPFPGTKLAVRQLFNRTCGIFVHSSKVKNQITSFLPGIRTIYFPLPLFDIYCISNLTSKEARKKLDITSSKVLLFFGYLRKYKGLDFLKEVISKLNLVLDDWELILAGEEWKTLSSRKAPSFPSNQVKLIKHFIQDEEVEVYFKSADLLLCTYTEEATQSGVLSLAYAFNLPVVATPVGSFTEFILPDKTGILASTPESFANAIVDFFNKNKKEKMQKEISKWKEKLFATPEIIVKTFKDEFN